MIGGGWLLFYNDWNCDDVYWFVLVEINLLCFVLNFFSKIVVSLVVVIYGYVIIDF